MIHLITFVVHEVQSSTPNNNTMSTNTIYFPTTPSHPPSLIRRSDSDSSIESTTSSLSVRTPTDNIFHRYVLSSGWRMSGAQIADMKACRTDEDFGGEPGLAMEDVLVGIKTLLLDGEVSHFWQLIRRNANLAVVASQIPVPTHFHLERCKRNPRHLEDHCKSCTTRTRVHHLFGV
jgi:hypothetical protein